MLMSSSLSLFRHRTANLHHILIRPTRFLNITAVKQHQNPNPNPNKVSRKPHPNKNLLRGKQTFKEYSSLAPLLSLDHVPILSDSQAIGTVAASQANFMRVIVQSLPDQSSKIPEITEREEDASRRFQRVGGEEEVSRSHNEEERRAGVELLCVVRAVLKKIKRRVVVGDKVVVGSIDWVDRRGMIENVFQRASEIVDPPVANVDHLLVLFSMEQPRLEPFILTRFLVEAESTGIPFTLALNKSELASDETLELWKFRLRSWGYSPVFCSVESKTGLDALAFTLRDQTSVIVGPSGVGKSSLINALRNNPRASDAMTNEGDNWFDPIVGSKWFENQPVGEVSRRSGRGKHTTRNVSLLPLSGGGYLADTPGFNQPSLMKVSKQSLALAFPEIRKMLSSTSGELKKCAFSDCLHLGEPGCVVKTDWERYPLYFQLLDEIRVREEFQLRTFGTKREDDVRRKVGDMGIQQAEPRLELKKHRRPSRKRLNQSILDELHDEEEEDLLLDENDPVLRALRNEHQ